jgi:hypothetical protein
VRGSVTVSRNAGAHALGYAKRAYYTEKWLKRVGGKRRTPWEAWGSASRPEILSVGVLLNSARLDLPCDHSYNARVPTKG